MTGADLAALVQDCYSAPDPPPVILFPIPGIASADAEKRTTVPLWTRIGTDTEVGIVDAGRGTDDMALANTLVCLQASGTARASLGAIAEGIDRADRDDAGLLVPVVAPEGALDEEAATTLRESGPEREAPISVIEDVGGSWARAFAAALDSGQSLRLVGVDGRLVW